jgi:hypothetical protein
MRPAEKHFSGGARSRPSKTVQFASELSKGDHMTRERLHAAWFAAALTLLCATIATAQQDLRLALNPPPIWESFYEMHDTYVRRFDASTGTGVSRMPQPLMLDRSGILDLGRERYSIERLELVGLLKRDHPVVYAPPLWNHSIRLVTADFKPRDLTALETRALAKLRAGRDLEAADGDESGTIALMGALRGEPSCLKCHKDKREGDLLGAFTYTLRVRQKGGLH